jgi:hypothetical protein
MNGAEGQSRMFSLNEQYIYVLEYTQSDKPRTSTVYVQKKEDRADQIIAGITMLSIVHTFPSSVELSPL